MQCQFESCQKESVFRGYCKNHYMTMRRRGKLPPLPVVKHNKCAVEDCENLVGGSGGYGYCSTHYQRYKKYGDPNIAIVPHLKGKTIEEKLLFNREIDENGCWNWTGAKICKKDSKFRYGVINTKNGKSELVHRLSYKFWVGEIPKGFFVCHKCDNPACFNPEHLFVGTNSDNMRDKVKKGRSYTGIHKGERNQNSKLTDRLVIIAKRYLLKNNKSIKATRFLAKKLEVSYSAIADLRDGKSWKHIPWPDLKELSRKRKRRSSI